MVKLYVSGKYAHWRSIRTYIEEAKNLDYEITWDWTSEEARALSFEEAAERDAKGCADCDVHLVIIDDPDHPYRGTWFEVGVSLASMYQNLTETNINNKINNNKFIIICNLTQNKFEDFPFYHHPSLIKTFSWITAKRALMIANLTLTSPRKDDDRSEEDDDNKIWEFVPWCEH